jgi:hypothetical protein
MTTRSPDQDLNFLYNRTKQDFIDLNKQNKKINELKKWCDMHAEDIDKKNDEFHNIIMNLNNYHSNIYNILENWCICQDIEFTYSMADELFNSGYNIINILKWWCNNFNDYDDNNKKLKINALIKWRDKQLGGNKYLNDYYNHKEEFNIETLKHWCSDKGKKLNINAFLEWCNQQDNEYIEKSKNPIEYKINILKKWCDEEDIYSIYNYIYDSYHNKNFISNSIIECGHVHEWDKINGINIMIIYCYEKNYFDLIYNICTQILNYFQSAINVHEVYPILNDTDIINILRHENCNKSFDGIDLINSIFTDVYCKNEHYIDIAKYVYDKISDLDLQKAFENACKANKLQIVQWLNTLKPTEYENINDLFISACKNGHLELAQWLYTLDKIDIHENNDSLFKSIKHVAVGKWIYNLDCMITITEPYPYDFVYTIVKLEEHTKIIPNLLQMITKLTERLDKIENPVVTNKLYTFDM